MQTLLLSISFPYRFGAQFKNWLYDWKILKPKTAPLPIISVGNITFGGAEKTPLVMEVLDFLIKEGFKPAMITRGYKGKWEKKGGILSDGKRILGSWLDSGDEPFMVVRNFPQVGIFVGKDRLTSCQRAAHSGFDFGVLDDGFQHRALRRDVDIVLYDPAAKSYLREPLSSLKRAHVLLIRRQDKLNKKKILLNKTTYFYSVEIRGFFRLGERKEEVNAERLRGKRVIAFCGIARPERFSSILGSEGIFPVSFLKFPDHHPFPPSSIEKILARCERTGAEAVIMTEKDAVKVAARFPLQRKAAYYLKMGLKLEDAFYRTLLSSLKDKERRF